MKYLLIILPFFANAQTVTTLTNATASTNTYLRSGISGVMNNGHVFFLDFRQNFSGSTPIAMDAVRIDATTGTVTTKNMVGSVSSSSALWASAMDNNGNIYMGLNSGNRKVWKVNCKGDSILLTNLGNCFVDSTALAYSIALGIDGNMYFGGSSGIQSTSCSYYDTQTGIVHAYPEVNAFQDFTVFCSGNSNYIYSEVGQRNNLFEIWSTRKSDGRQKLIASQTGLINYGTREAGMVFQINGSWYRLDDTVLISYPTYNATPEVFHCETTNSHCPTGYPTATSFYNSTTNTYSWNVDGNIGSTTISSTNVTNTIRRVFPDQTDSTLIYYIGENYGNSYKLANATTKTDLGFIGFNVYSTCQVNDSIIYYSGYPSGTLAKWNKNQAWTAETFYNGSLHHLSDSTNPQLIDYFRSYGGFHHGEKLVKVDSFLVCAGTVIRVANSCSIATYDMAHDTMYGYDYNKIGAITHRDIAVWRKKVLFSTTGSGAKLYIYDPATNLMDSIETGFSDNGKIYVTGDKVIGVASDRIYNYNLVDRVLINQHIYASNSISFSYQMPDGRILITSTGITLPRDMSFDFVQFSGYANLESATSSKIYGTTSNNANAVQLNDYFRMNCGTQSPVYAANMNFIRLGMTATISVNINNVLFR